ncbi:hypothetical protein L227DRAFT_304373 [Lentinus tigrinus ALCF2SS1-6]|uniref:Uncharacterized protein n=1 Tax=Lentinus tigrinus ALCF2SS1-6 TaxID=1328759 RepID=A0A5C2RV11_9APHY|nr:hypothetical protein L227DRAFT_304373 [Lentinus tigrinus ALCF2SS1-6]
MTSAATRNDDCYNPWPKLPPTPPAWQAASWTFSPDLEQLNITSVSASLYTRMREHLVTTSTTAPSSLLLVTTILPAAGLLACMYPNVVIAHRASMKLPSIFLHVRTLEASIRHVEVARCYDFFPSRATSTSRNATEKRRARKNSQSHTH